MFSFLAGTGIFGAGIIASSIGLYRKSLWLKLLGGFWLILGVVTAIIGLVIINGGYW